MTWLDITLSITIFAVGFLSGGLVGIWAAIRLASQPEELARSLYESERR